YTASKAAVAAITQSLGAELASTNIWVNAVVPSIMDTRANRKAMPAADFAKWPKLDEVAATIAFLASPDNRVTRGALVPVYGQHWARRQPGLAGCVPCEPGTARG